MSTIEDFYSTPESIKQSKDQSTAVNTKVKWIPVDDPTDPCPEGCKVQLINEADKIAIYGVYWKGDTRWTHWQGVPDF